MKTLVIRTKNQLNKYLDENENLIYEGSLELKLNIKIKGYIESGGHIKAGEYIKAGGSIE